LGSTGNGSVRIASNLSLPALTFTIANQNPRVYDMVIITDGGDVPTVGGVQSVGGGSYANLCIYNVQGQWQIVSDINFNYVPE
jgi:hypothetical protein